MANLFLVLAIFSGGVALGGYVWSTALRLRSRNDAAREADVARAGAIWRSNDAPGVEKAADAPDGGSVTEGESSISLSGVGRQVRREGWRRAVPGLLCAGGMLMLLVSGALALLTSLPEKALGVVALGISLYVAIAELHSFRRALRD
jgi:hypothetical protein